jgi:hypothetical protein
MQILQVREFEGFPPVRVQPPPLFLSCCSLAARLSGVIDQYASEHNTLPEQE